MTCNYGHHRTLAMVTLLAVAILFQFAFAANLVWYAKGSPVTYAIDTKVDPVVETAMAMFADDIKNVTGHSAEESGSESSTIVLTQIDRASESQRKVLEANGVPLTQVASLTDGFHISVKDDRIYVVGANGRGTAYGLLELSRMAGVSPWIWWGDVVPEKKDSLVIDENFSTTQGASVEYRGIFINDEDWSLRPWSSQTFEPNEEGTIGPKTYKEIFKLLMRLRGNAIWPAMHPGTTAFFKNPFNKLMADSCGIAVGSSHCEPLLRNNVDEWDVKKRGAFNYMTNREAVHEYWTERLKEVKGSPGGNMFTIGMRGIHDGSMEGVKTPQEKFDALQRVIDDQQQLIAMHIGDPSRQMQVFVPYKEVLELYEQGLKIPDYVTLMWCDDNYGYLTRLSDSQEQKRTGGGGVYYHLSYWGRPHDHLWLSTTQPGLIYNELRTAYDHNAKRLWIANVHDPKAAAYDLSLFLDMAWDVESVTDSTVGNHLERWLKTNFGEYAGSKIYPAMRKYYDLTAKRKPEFMGWSQVELDKKIYERGLSPVADTEFSFSEFGSEADRYMEEWLKLVETAGRVAGEIRPELGNAYVAAVLYPVTVAAMQSVKMLEAQRARHLAACVAGTEADSIAIKGAAAKSMLAYQTIKAYTECYNKQMNRGKWDGLMSDSPRNLPAFGEPLLPVSFANSLELLQSIADVLDGSEHPLLMEGAISRAASGFDRVEGSARRIDMFGHSGSAVALDKGSSVHYDFEVGEKDSFKTLTVAMIPTQPNDGGDLRFSVSVDGSEPTIHSLKEPFRSDRWKQNVLRGQALRKIDLPDLSPGIHTFIVTALDSHIVLDQWIIDSDPQRKYYLIPAP